MLCAFARHRFAQGLLAVGRRRYASWSRIRRAESATRSPARSPSGPQRRLGVPVIVENRGGAGGVVAMESLKRAPPDGRTLVFSAVSPLTVAPLLGPIGFDPDRDVTPVMSVMITPGTCRRNPCACRGHAGGGDLGSESESRRGALGDVRRRDDGSPRAATACRSRARSTSRMCRTGVGTPDLRRAGRRVRSAVLERRRNCSFSTCGRGA